MPEDTTSFDLFGAEHVRRYVETDGAVGYDWNGTTILILTTTGRRSGEPRSTPLIYTPYGEACVVIASKGGADQPPDWFLNLEADPHVEVQVKGDRFAATARVASPAEKPALWAQMTPVWPAYDEYQAKTEREIPVVVLERS